MPTASRPGTAEEDGLLERARAETGERRLLTNTLLRAWRALSRFEGRSSLRSWLYTIATNTCLDQIARRPKRALPIDYGPATDPHVGPGEPLVESVWIEPYPDEIIGVQDRFAVPDARYQRRESVELAFVAALQHLPASQRAGRDAIERWAAASPLAGDWRWRTLRSSANAQPALGFYAWNAHEQSHRAFALNVLSLRADRVSGVTAFIARSTEPRDREVFERYPDEPVDAAKVDDVFARFGLPAQLD